MIKGKDDHIYANLIYVKRLENRSHISPGSKNSLQK